MSPFADRQREVRRHLPERVEMRYVTTDLDKRMQGWSTRAITRVLVPLMILLCVGLAGLIVYAVLQDRSAGTGGSGLLFLLIFPALFIYMTLTMRAYSVRRMEYIRFDRTLFSVSADGILLHAQGEPTDRIAWPDFESYHFSKITGFMMSGGVGLPLFGQVLTFRDGGAPRTQSFPLIVRQHANLLDALRLYMSAHARENTVVDRKAPAHWLAELSPRAIAFGELW